MHSARSLSCIHLPRAGAARVSSPHLAVFAQPFWNSELRCLPLAQQARDQLSQRSTVFSTEFSELPHVLWGTGRSDAFRAPTNTLRANSVLLESCPPGVYGENWASPQERRSLFWQTHPVYTPGPGIKLFPSLLLLPAVAYMGADYS